MEYAEATQELIDEVNGIIELMGSDKKSAMLLKTAKLGGGSVDLYIPENIALLVRVLDEVNKYEYIDMGNWVTYNFRFYDWHGSMKLLADAIVSKLVLNQRLAFGNKCGWKIENLRNKDGGDFNRGKK